VTKSGSLTPVTHSVWLAVAARKRQAADRAEARAAELRAEADELEAAYYDSQAS
jgi:hypothetical protein